MNHKLTLLFVCLFVTKSLLAQTDEDALRYSQLTPFGTARFMGAGGAFGALGADISALSTNPAGVAIYRGNEFTFTPGLSFIRSQTDFLKNNNDSRKYNFNISNFGFVWVSPNNSKDARWKSVNFSFGSNRMANLHNNIYYRGLNTSNSLMNNYMSYLGNNAVAPSALDDAYPFDISLAYDTKLITYTPFNNTYKSALTKAGLEQSKSINTRGAVNEYYFAFGGNYNDKLYIGASVNMPFLRYVMSSTFSERDRNDSIPDFIKYDLTNNLRTSGVGINIKAGLIYRVNDYLRLGTSIHSPTFFTMTDRYSSSINSAFVSGSYESFSPNGNFNYSLVTPWRVVGSAAVLFKKYGFLSADYELVDYSSAYYNFNNGNTSDKEFENIQNNLITTKYTASGNLRIGAEAVLDIFRVRAGYAFYGSPFQTGLGVNGFANTFNNLSAGFGFREQDFYLDFAFVRSIFKSYEQPYSLPAGQEVPGARIQTGINHFLITIGFRY